VPESRKAHAAPPVLEYGPDGRFLNAWGGNGKGYDWPANEHGIFIDHKDVVWIGGSGVGDDMLLKFTNTGAFIRQFGARAQSKGNADRTNVNRPADIFVNAKTNEAFVADGYGNRRVIVLDAETGAFKRMWGAFGNPPDNDPPAAANAVASVTRSTLSRSRTMVSYMSPIVRTDGFRCSRRKASTLHKCSSIASAQPPPRLRDSGSHPTPVNSFSTQRISETQRLCRCFTSLASGARNPATFRHCITSP
jgi:hypothetical protein